MQNPNGGIPNQMGTNIPGQMQPNMGQLSGFSAMQGNLSNPQLQLQQQFMQLQQQQQQQKQQQMQQTQQMQNQQQFQNAFKAQMQAYTQMQMQMNPQMQAQFRQMQMSYNAKNQKQYNPYMMPPPSLPPQPQQMAQAHVNMQQQQMKQRRPKSSVSKHPAPANQQLQMGIGMNMTGNTMQNQQMASNFQQQMNMSMTQQQNIQSQIPTAQPTPPSSFTKQKTPQQTTTPPTQNLVPPPQTNTPIASGMNLPPPSAPPSQQQAQSQQSQQQQTHSQSQSIIQTPKQPPGPQQQQMPTNTMSQMSSMVGMGQRRKPPSLQPSGSQPFMGGDPTKQMPMSGIMPPSIPMQLPPQINQPHIGQQMSSIVPEAHYVHQLLKTLDKERADLFFRLFNVRKQKRSEERPEMFMSTIYPVLRNLAPNISIILCKLIESLRVQQETFNKLLEPPIPLVFARQRQHKPLYSLVRLAPPSGVELTPTNKDRKAELFPIGTFISLLEPYPQNATVIIDKNEIHPLHFGTSDQSFYIPAQQHGKYPARFQVHFTTPPISLLTWFTIQFVECKQPKDVLYELLNSKNLVFNPQVPVIAKTPKCNGCSFDALKAIEEIISTGSSKCPICHENIILNELEFNLPTSQADLTGVSEDEAALTLAKLELADQVCALSPPAVENRSWCDLIFNGSGQTAPEYRPLSYNNTKEYISSILTMN